MSSGSNGAQILEQMAQIERWIAQRKPRTEVYAESFTRWRIKPRQVQRLIARVRDRRIAELKAARPYEIEEIEASMNLVFHAAMERGDAAALEVARKTIRDLARFRGFDTGMPTIAPAPNVSINVDLSGEMRKLTPIERTQRLEELYRKRIASGLTVEPAPPGPETVADMVARAQNIIDAVSRSAADDGDDEFDDEADD